MSAWAGPRFAHAVRSEIVFGACVLAVVAATFAAVPNPQSIPGAGLGAIALFIARVDWRARIIPNAANLAAAVLALVEAAFSSEDVQVALIDASTRGAALFAMFLAFRWAFFLWRGQQGMGLGDVKLAGVLGLWLDWSHIPIAVEMACLSAIAYVLARKIVGGGRLDPKLKVPFGVFLGPAIWLTWLSAKLFY